MNYDQLVEHVRARCTIDLTSGCWFWAGCCANKKVNDTPVMRLNNRVAPVRRMLLEGKFPDKKINFASNRCKSPLCVAPDHLVEIPPGGTKKRTLRRPGVECDNAIVIHREVGQWKAEIPAVRSVFDLGATV